MLLVRELAWRYQSNPWRLVVPLIAVASIEAVIGLLQHAANSETAAHGTYVNKNHFAGLLEMTLPLAVMYAAALLRREGSVAGIPVTAVIKACGAIAAALVIFSGILYSLSRMGFTAALFALFVMGSIAIGAGVPAWKKWLVVLGFAALFLYIFIFLPSDELVRQFGKLAPTNVSEGRLSLWEDTLRLVAAYPLFGCGLGGYESAFTQYQASFLLMRVDYAHNDFLQVVAELGALGSLIAAGLAVMVVLPALRAAATRSNNDGRYLAIGCTGAFVAILIHSCADFNLYIPANGFLLAWICGIAASLPFI